MARIRKNGRKLVALLAVFIVGGCAHQPAEPVSLERPPGPPDAPGEPAADRQVKGIPLAEYLQARVFRLTGNMAPVRTGDDTMELKVIDEGKPRGFGWAVPLTADGYFLTAAHILNKLPEPFYLMNWTTATVSEKPVRVVWDGWDGVESGEIDVLISADFAIVHMPLESGHHAEWAWDWNLRAGIEMIAPGGNDFWPPRLTSGRLLSVGPGVEGYGTIASSGKVGTIVLQHDAHVGHGASGAPVFLPGGRLVGITIGGGSRRVRPAGPDKLAEGDSEEQVPVAVAIRPDPDSVAQIIRNDRRHPRAHRPHGMRSERPPARSSPPSRRRGLTPRNRRRQPDRIPL